MRALLLALPLLVAGCPAKCPDPVIHPETVQVVVDMDLPDALDVSQCIALCEHAPLEEIERCQPGARDDGGTQPLTCWGDYICGE